MNNGEGQAMAWNVDTQLDGNSVLYLEEMYERYLQEPGSIPASWQHYFDALLPLLPIIVSTWLITR
jgi:2-oxoglutarate dehydrogenase E1 component